MKKLIVLLLVVLLILMAFPRDSHAGPWTLKKGKIWGEVFFRYFFAKHYFDPKAEKHRWGDGGFSEIYDLEIKGEYGVTDRLNLLLGIPYAWSNWKNDWGIVNPLWGKFKHEGFKEINFGAKYKFTDKPLVIAGQVKVYIDTGPDETKQPDLYEYGSGVEPRILIGKSWRMWKKMTYVSFETGYHFRSDWANEDDYGNHVPIFAEAGFAPFNWLMIKGEVDTIISDPDTGIRKDTFTWRAGPIIKLIGEGFNSVTKGGEQSLNLEFLYGITAWGRGDGRTERYQNVSSAQEFIMKVSALF